jgi:glycosyltransferase involved in cell wall biosynthesis
MNRIKGLESLADNGFRGWTRAGFSFCGAIRYTLHQGSILLRPNLMVRYPGRHGRRRLAIRAREMCRKVKLELAPPRVFIVLALYKPPEALLARQLESLAQQDYPTYDVICVADGPDALSEMASATIRAYPGVTLHVQERNLGVRGSFYTGLRIALERSEQTSDLFCFCDQDDYWYSHKLRTQQSLISESGASACHGELRVTDSSGSVLYQSVLKLENRKCQPTLLDLCYRNHLTGMSMMMAKPVVTELLEIGPTLSSRYLHDYAASLVAAAMDGIVCIREPVADYVQHGANLIGAGRGNPIDRGEKGRRRSLSRLRSALQGTRNAIEKLAMRSRMEPRYRSLALQEVQKVFGTDRSIWRAGLEFLRRAGRGDLSSAKLAALNLIESSGSRRK